MEDRLTGGADVLRQFPEKRSAGDINSGWMERVPASENI